MKHRKCVAFMLIQNNQLLAEKRKLTKLVDPGATSIPGGFIDPGETPEKALFRDAKEELGIILIKPRFVCSLIEKLDELYPIDYFFVDAWSGEIECNEAESLLWIPLEESDTLDLEVDRIAVSEYRRIYAS
jgi:8-oxo-dGTP pyrophosphatase MutT (NUDIX family)